MPATMVKFEDPLLVHERDKKVMELLVAAMPRRKIAEHLGVDVDEVDRAHIRCIGATPPDYKARVVNLAAERMDALIRANWVKSQSGSEKHSKVIISAERFRCQLVGVMPLPVRDDALDDLKEVENSTEYYRRVFDRLMGKPDCTIEGEATETAND